MRNHSLVTRPVQSRLGLALALVVVSVFGVWLNAKADETLPSSTPDFPSVIRANSDQLVKVESDKGASNLFVSAMGPALEMGDVARTLGANPLPAKLAKELLVPDLTAAVLRLMGSLVAWHLASTVRQAVRDQQLPAVAERRFGSPQARAWLDQQGTAPWHESLNLLGDVVASPEWAKGNQEKSPTTLLLALLERATRLELDAMQAVYQEWDRIRNWKDRVRELRGQARLCGTW